MTLLKLDMMESMGLSGPSGDAEVEDCAEQHHEGTGQGRDTYLKGPQ